MSPPRRMLALATAAAAIVPACGLNQEGVPPPNNALFFPASAVVDPSGNWLFVANANSDLRYNDGTLVAVDLQAAAAKRNLPGGGLAPWPPCPQVNYVQPYSDPNPSCCWDLLDRTVLNCSEVPLINGATTVRIGSFAAGMVWQPACLASNACARICDTPDPDNGRLFLGVRGNSSLTWVNVALSSAPSVPPTFACSAQPGAFAECDSSHEFDEFGPQSIAPSSALPDEPYALALDHTLNLLYVGHLRGDVAHPDTGGVSLFDVSSTYANVADPQQLPIDAIGPFPSIFPPDVNGLFGVTALLPALARTVVASSDVNARRDQGKVFVSSRFVPRVGSMVTTALPCASVDESTALLPGPDSFDTTLVGSEDRGIQFLPGDPPTRAFVLQRVPPALVGFDLTPNQYTGMTQTIPTDVIETCANPTFLDRHNPGGAGSQLYVTCFETGQIYVVDPTVPRIVTTINVGRGPSGLAFGPGPNDPLPVVDPDTTTRAYVVGFGDNNISVLDLDPESPTRYHVILRIGYPSTTPR